MLTRIWTGQRVYFGKDTHIDISNYSIDISGMTGTITHIMVWDNWNDLFMPGYIGYQISVRLDSLKYAGDLAAWDNCVEFYGGPTDWPNAEILATKGSSIPHDHNEPGHGTKIFFLVQESFKPLPDEPQQYRLEAA